MLEELGFVNYFDNIWFKYTELNGKTTPHFVLKKFVNPKENKIIVRNLLDNESITTDNYIELEQFLKKTQRNQKLNELLN